MRPNRAGNPVAQASLPLMASIVLLLSLATPAASASGLRAAPSATIAVRLASLEITVPASANLSSGQSGGSISASLGTLTVTDIRLGNPSWTVAVSATDFITGGSPAQTITKTNISYWSGSTTASSGGGTRLPGQTTAAQKVVLSTPRTAFSGRKSLVLPQSTNWQPTLVVTVPADAVAGTYTGTITHSVA